MMCHAMRERMLDADIDELEGRGTSLLATHVRECASCAAVARGIVRDTRVLASVASRSPGGVVALAARRWRGGRYLVIGGAAAAVLLIARFHAPPDSTEPLIVAPAVSAATPGTAELTPVPLRARRFADATPVEAVPLRSFEVAPVAEVANEPAMVRVDPPAGVRAAVMQTNNPSITVVVLYKPLSGPPQ